MDQTISPQLAPPTSPVPHTQWTNRRGPVNGILRFGRQLEGADYRTVQGILTRLARQAGWDVNEDLRTYQDGARAIKIWSGNRVIIIERAGAGGPRKGIPAGSWYAKISPGDQGLYGNTPYRIKLGP